MYETEKIVTCGDVKATIYKNMHGEYFAECEEYHYKGKIPLGNDYHYLWDKLDAELGCGEIQSGEEILRIAKIIETQHLTENTTYGEICIAVEDYLFKAPKLYPSHVYSDLIYILESRYGRVTGSEKVRVKLSPTASVKEWFQNAITTQRIYRLTTKDEYDKQTVRIIGAHCVTNDYLVEFEVLQFGTDNNQRITWVTNETFIKLLSDCTLEHRLTDELPPDYKEVSL